VTLRFSASTAAVVVAAAAAAAGREDRVLGERSDAAEWSFGGRSILGDLRLRG